MKLNHLVAAAVLAVSGAQAFAVTQGESFNTASSTYKFGASEIDANGTFTFTLDATEGAMPGVYNIVGSLSATNFSFTGVTLNSQSWTVNSVNNGKASFGYIELTSSIPLSLSVSGIKTGTGAGVFSGELVMAPVPEPETYALMLAGLGAVGFVAWRRRSN
ncbi:FxDxF family PEP-CTERM protein [Aquincola sp. J276]|uniref:FxDxF family PEP-CTERM protein n=1 Tax=Aquincola sp. J276 TaxID=2898432 RepID=UPI002151EB19|nr:FxDxF family PEP-CTERM protein [Aquincola sp. J276]MCR5867505.1 FxDxF family PEP-CTERM protein [Aquincola sp. J276]